MIRRRSYVAVAGLALAAALSLGLVYGVFQGQPGATTGQEAVLASAEGAGEAIKVHGHWTIEIREPDGSVASRHEFHNWFEGDELLAQILTRQGTVGLWQIFLYTYDAAYDPWPGGGAHIVESSVDCGALPYAFCFNTLSVSTSGTGQNTEINFHGTAVAERDGWIETVGTWLGVCEPSVPPDSCVDQFEGTMTESYLIPEPEVLADQVIVVDVAIGFSS